MGLFKTGMALRSGLVLAGIFGFAFGASGQGLKNGAQKTASRGKYFLAAKPVGVDAVNSYPASLFTVAGDHRLRLVRQFFKSGEHFSAFADDLHGTVYLAGRSGIYVIPGSDPRKAVFVPVHRFDNTFCWGAVYGGGTRAGVQYCPGRNVAFVAADQSHKNQAGEQPGDWAAFKHLQFGGQNGGPYQVGPPTAEIDGTNLVMPYGEAPKVVLAKLPTADEASPDLRRRVSILASTKQYLAIWIEPAAFTALVGGVAGAPSRRSSASAATGAVTQPPHAAPVRVLVLNRQSHRWRTLELPTAVSATANLPVRLFGNWMVTTLTAWSPPAGKTGSPGQGTANLQKTPITYASADVHAAYERRFHNLVFPGKLAIWNLADGRKLTLRTGQEDSEVLGIAKDGEMLYRVNDAIYSAEIDGSKIGKPALVVKAPEVTNIHWVFGN